MRWSGRVPTPVDQPSVWWSLLIVAAAVIGGLAAAGLRHVPLLLAVLVPVGVGGITVYALAKWPAQQPAPPTPPLPAGPYPCEARPMPAPVSQAEAEDLVRLQPIVSRPATDGPWWQKADGPSALPSQDVLLGPAPNVVGYLDSALIAQCPDCGAFGLEAKRMQAPNRWGFRCESCDFTWPWQLGTPWPPVRVRPWRRKQSRRPAP